MLTRLVSLSGQTEESWDNCAFVPGGGRLPEAEYRGSVSNSRVQPHFITIWRGCFWGDVIGKTAIMSQAAGVKLQRSNY